MFRAAAAGPYDEGINKATDENLTSEDWGAIMEVCDRVTTDANGPKESVQSLIKRLAHRNANVQLYTLEVANALSQNCGKNMHRELSSRAFTDALLKLANDRNTHQQVKAKILERMKDWSDMFKSDPDLGIMYDAYYRLKQSNPTLQPPSAPQKNSLTDVDRQKEEDELQMALRLSLQEEERKKKPVEVAAGPSGAGGSGAGQQQAAPNQPVPSGTTAATVSRVRALYDFVPSEPGELDFKKGDVIAVLESVYKDWWRGSLKGKTGIFPLNYVEKLTDPTPDELLREAQMEAEVFAEIKNVEKAKLYHQTLAIRPKLIKLIEKYSQKKDDFTQLNEKFIKARRDYEALLESSMATARPLLKIRSDSTPRHLLKAPQQQQQPPQQQQQQYPQRPPEQRHPSSSGKQPAPLQTSASPPPANQYASYQPAPQPSARPQSTYGAAPQELSTSVYDSPIAPQNANPIQPYPSSAYATPDEDPYAATAASRVQS
ncbi:ESCRT-0 subunit protein hse1 [Collariella sp. IMI 366227]|nr:ESCRT-0 subunit protein hse1 [Collariella sp. IMI 366227]